MEMKINLDQLFSASQTVPPNQLNTTLESQSLNRSLEWQGYSVNNSFDYKYTLSQPIFESDSNPILHSEEDALEGPSETVLSTHSRNNVTIITHQSMKTIKPGERLFYQSQQHQARKVKEREQIKQEKIAAAAKMSPFVPTINQNSKKIMQQMNKMEKKPKKAKKEILSKTTVQIREEQVAKQCTFQPKLVAKGNGRGLKNQDQLFYYLHNTSKLKQLKANHLKQDKQKPTKKGTQSQVDDFLKRNQEYQAVTRKKHQILKQNTQMYDLKTGEKLFSPKITDGKSFNFHTAVPVKQLQRHDKQVKQKQQKKEQPQKKLQPAKSNIFKKQYNYMTPDRQPIKQDNAILALSPQDIQEGYRQYSQDYDRLMMKERSLSSKNQVIPEEQSEPSNNEHSNQRSKTFEQDHIQPSQSFNPDAQKECEIIEDVNMWSSKEMKPFDVSNVAQYLNQSEEDEVEPKNNYVMEILNNLMDKKDEE